MADLPNLNLVSTPSVSSTAILRSTAVIGDARIEGQMRFDQLEVGKSFQAVITSMMQDGKATVQFTPIPPQTQGTQLQMQLPAGLGVGDTIQLKLVKPAPDVAFQLNNPSLPSNPESVDLSSGAKLLNQLLQTADPNNPQTNHIKGNQSLLPMTPTDIKQMASDLPGHLHQAVQLSGAFYESHLKEWVNGERSLELVKQEPQNQTKALLKNSPDQPIESPQTQLIPAQLNAQENRQFIWRGELIPGQAFEWQIKDDTPKQSANTAAPEEKSWQTSVKFHLPQLGQIHAVINLAGNSAAFRISAQQPNSANLLIQAKDQLHLSLEATGTQMTQFLVEKDGSKS
jgi:hypothetical protein